MRIELLVFDGCPNLEPARELFQAGMASLGIAGEVREIRVETPEAARQWDFPGSPTLRVNGEDVAPLPEGFEPALGCRTYVVQGLRQGLPDAAWVLEALRKAQNAEAHACCTPLAKPRTAASCPACGTEGKPVKPITLRALLQPHLRAEVRDEVYRFCARWIGEIKGQNAGWRGIKGGLQAPGGWVGGLEPGRFGKDLSVSTRISPFRAGSSSPGAWRGPPSGIGGGREPWDRPRGEIPS